jgi:gluconokinase
VNTRTSSFKQKGPGREEPCIVTLDIGTSSVRALVFDARGRQCKKFGAQIPYSVETTAGGGVEVDAGRLADLAVESLSALHEQMRRQRVRPAAVAGCTFWHNVLGVTKNGRAATPVLHPFDTRADGAAAKLRLKIDSRALHSRTGCVLHASYLPAKLFWLSEARPRAFHAARRWMSFAEYFMWRLFGEGAESVSMVSGSGLWNQNENCYDEEVLRVLPVEPCQFFPPETMDQPLTSLRKPFKTRWPLFDGVPWYPALGDGACNNMGSDCHSPQRFALMVGTSGALRATYQASYPELPGGLWCYRVDRRRLLLGGALSDGGEVYAWMRRTLALPSASAIESQLANLAPGSHRLTVLPLFAGERSTNWRAGARAAIAGLGAGTQPIEILRAALEAVALRFRMVYDQMSASLGAPREVVASGGALLRSRVWTQMMADALARPVVACLEGEASSRGAALVALERLAIVEDARELNGRMGRVYEPIPAHCRIYEEELQRQQNLYSQLYPN